MQNFILTKLLKWVGRRLDGYITKIGACSSILIGVLYIIPVMFPSLQVEGLPQGDIDKGYAFISGGIVALGIGNKIQKNTDAVRAIRLPEKYSVKKTISSGDKCYDDIQEDID